MRKKLDVEELLIIAIALIVIFFGFILIGIMVPSQLVTNTIALFIENAFNLVIGGVLIIGSILIFIGILIILSILEVI